MKKILIGLLLIGLQCFFVSNSHAAGGLGTTKITAVAFHLEGFFMYADNWPNPNGCTKSDAIVLLDSDQNYEKAFALLLAAYMAGKSVSGYSNGCTSHDGQTYNTIRGYKYLTVS